MSYISNGYSEGYIPYIEDDEIYIDFKNLASHLFVKWRVIIICSLIAALVGGVIGFAAQKELKNAPSNNNTASEATLKLSDERIAEAEGYYSQLCAYNEAIDIQKMSNSSYIMKLDQSTAVGYYLQYLLQTDIDNVSSAFLESIITETDYEKIADIIGMEPGKIGVNEAVVFRIDDISTNSFGPDINAKVVFSACINASNSDFCKGIVEIVKDSIDSRMLKYKEQGAIITCILVDEGYNNANSRNYIAAKKQEKTNALGTLMTNRTNFYNNVVAKTNADEKLYIDGLLGETNGAVLEEAPTVGIFGENILKYALVGFLMGLFVPVCWFVISYIIAGKLRTAEELEECCRIPILQTLSNDIKGQANLDMLSRELESKTKQGDIKLVYVAVDGTSVDAKDVVKRVLESAHGDATYIVGKLDLDPCDMGHLLDSESVLLFPTIDHTKMRVIRRFIEICERNGKYIIGSAPVRETNNKT